LIQVCLGALEFLAEVFILSWPHSLLLQVGDKVAAYGFSVNLQVWLSLWECQGGHGGAGNGSCIHELFS